MDDFDAKNRIFDIQREAANIRLARLAQAGAKVATANSLGPAFAASALLLFVLGLLR